MEASANNPDPVAKSNKTVAIALGAIVVVVVVGLIAFFALRTSPEEKALQSFCESRVSVQQHVESLATMTPTTVTLDAIKSDLDAIRDGVATMRQNEQELGVDRKSQIRQATGTFFSQLGSIGSSLLRSTSVDDARKAVETAGAQLLASYEETLAPIDCSGVDVD